ncbi:MAG: PAS domain S-box protein [Planctomycetota bacterium]|nr:PAS domain S-box protein [Planctomycetota bacterium]
MQSEEKYRSLVENLPDVVWTVDQAGNTIFISQNIEKVCGYTPEEIYEAGDSLWLERIHPEDIGKVEKAYGSFFKLHKRLDVEYKSKRKDGSWIWLYDRAVAPYEKDGVLYGDGVSSDITRRKDAEEKMLLLQTLVMAVSTSKDLHDALVITLEKVCNATGWDYGEAWIPNPEGTHLVRDHTFYSSVIGMKEFNELSGAFRFPPNVGLPGRAWSTKQPVWIQDVTCDPNYLRATIAMHAGLKTGIAFPVIAGEEVVAVIVFYTFEPLEKNERLTCLVFSAAVQLGKVIKCKRMEAEHATLREMLYHAQRLESIGKLAGGVAHNFNNILMVILGYASMLRSEMKKDDPLQNYVQKILTSSESAAQLIRDLLMLSRKAPNNPKPVKLNEIIKKAARLLPKFIGEGVELKTTLTEKDPTIMADVIQIEQALMNLASNARDAMPRGGFLAINTDVVKLDNNFIIAYGYGKLGMYAFISVTDTGVGMDAEMKERIFEPFFTTKEVGQGTGLGLAIVYGIVKQHNGYIDVYSELGKGTTFKIYLPLVEPIDKTETPEDLTTPEGGTETILIAEDETEVRKLTKMVLSGFGYKIIEAVDGEDAIHKFMENKDKIQLLVFDVVMPHKNGKEAYDAIKERKPDMKAIFMSGYGEDVIYKKDLLCEGFNFISKPILPRELLKKVREALDK